MEQQQEEAGAHCTHKHEHTHTHVHASSEAPSLLAGYRLAAEANFGQRLTYRVPLTTSTTSSAGTGTGTGTGTSSSSSSSSTAAGRRRCGYDRCTSTCEQQTSGSGSKLSVCGGCRAVRYCSRGCQAADWKAGHRALCKPLKPRGSDDRAELARGAGRAAEDGAESDDEAEKEEQDEDEDAESVPHLVEVLQNLQSVSITILHRGELAAPEDVRVHVSDTHLWYCPSASTRHKIPLYGADVDASKATVQLLPDHVLVKIPLRSASNASIHNDSHLLEAQKLPSLAEVNQLHCRACGESLLRAGHAEPEASSLEPRVAAIITKVFSLPSTYWLELADFWTCGNCCAFRQFPTDEIKAAPGVCFVSDTFLMLHSSQVDYALPPQGDKQLEGLVSAGSEVGWSPIACRACSAPLGVKEIPPIVQEHVSLRLFTYRITNRSPSAVSPIARNYFRTDTLERFVAKHLLASSSIHAVYRFVIKAFESDKPMLLIILMNWRSTLASNMPLLQDAGRGLAPIAKLRYADCTAPGEDAPSLLSGGSSEVRAEELVLWQAECEELLHILHKRNQSCLPSSLSHFCGMPLSFLYH